MEDRIAKKKKVVGRESTKVLMNRMMTMSVTDALDQKTRREGDDWKYGGG